MINLDSIKARIVEILKDDHNGVDYELDDLATAFGEHIEEGYADDCDDDLYTYLDAAGVVG